MKTDNWKSTYYKGRHRWINNIDNTHLHSMELGFGGSAMTSTDWTGTGGDIYHGLNSLFGIAMENTSKVMIGRNKLTFVIKNNSNFGAHVKVYKVRPAKAFVSGSAGTRDMLAEWTAIKTLNPGVGAESVLHDWDVRMDPNWAEWFKVTKTKMYKWLPGETKVFTLKMPKLKKPMRADILMSGHFKTWLTRGLWFQITGFPVHEGTGYTPDIGPAPVFFDIQYSWTFKAWVADQDFQKTVNRTTIGQTWTTLGEGQQYQAGTEQTTTAN